VVYVIHLGVNESFTPLSNNVGDLFRPFALFVGARNGYKNFKLAVQAVARISGLDFVCVGGGDLRDQELRLLNKMLPNLWRHERFVTDDKLNYLYNKAVCLVYPSSYEGFGIPVLEAMRAGCPVVAFRGSSIPEVVGDAALLFDILDPLALAAMIHKTLDTSERDRLRKLGFIRASEFSWKKTIERTVRVYEQLLGQPLLERNSKVET
jgi:mannosyltransferase